MVEQSASTFAPHAPARPILTGKMLAALSTAALAACSVVGIREAEEPAFTVAARVADVEIRSYGVRIAAETMIAGDELDARNIGFRRLAAYIFGANHAGRKIAMTAPVAQAGQKIAMTAPVSARRDGGGRWVIRFFMPKEFSLATLPLPNDAVVRLVEVPAETLAVLRFAGSPDPEAVARHQQALLGRLGGGGWQPVGPVVAWFYDPPWTLPFLRRNEVAVPVERRH